jgi:hypothetical protein
LIAEGFAELDVEFLAEEGGGGEVAFGAEGGVEGVSGFVFLDDGGEGAEVASGGGFGVAAESVP